MNILLIDDQRTKEFIKATYGLDVTKVAADYFDGIKELQFGAPWDILLLDHDLGTYNVDGKELNGTHIMDFLEANPDLLPKKIVLVTSNPVGRKNMQAIIDKIYGER